MSGKETYTARWNGIQPKLMEALQASKLSSRSRLLNLTEHLSTGFYPLGDDAIDDDLEVCEALEAVFDTER